MTKFTDVGFPVSYKVFVATKTTRLYSVNVEKGNFVIPQDNSKSHQGWGLKDSKVNGSMTNWLGFEDKTVEELLDAEPNLKLLRLAYKNEY